MFGGVGEAWSILMGSPWIGFGVFAAVTAGVIFLLSGRDWFESVLGLVRVFLTIFTTPFIFMRDALSILRGSSDAEVDYLRTRVFTLFRYSRIQYLTVFICALLILSAGLTTSLLALYPSSELAMQRHYREQVEQIETEIEQTNAAIGAAASPEYLANLQTQRDEAQTAFETQQSANAVMPENPNYQRDITYRLMNARSLDSVSNLRDYIDSHMAGCPNNYNWRGFTADACMQFRAYLQELATRKEREINLRQAYQDAETALQQADSAAQEANARLAMLQTNLDSAKEQAKSVSLVGPQWLIDHGLAAFGVLLSTFISVIVFIWLCALILDFLNWLILMMRSLEKTQAAKLERSDAEYPLT